MTRLIIGCGYLGGRVARGWAAQGDTVHVLTRSAARAEHLRAAGYLPLVGDVTDPATFPILPSVDTVLWALGYDRQSGRSIHEVYVEGLGNVLARLAPGTRRFLYMSSTGVYGQQDGSWVDETSPCLPRREGGKACLAAEQQLLASTWCDRAVILRLAGIYGAQRLPRLEQLRSRAPLSSDPDAVINLIHVEDAAEAILRVAQRPLVLPRTFLIADAQPVTRRAFYQELARQSGLPSPIFAGETREAVSLHQETSNSRMANRSGSHKRVSNQRMVSELGIQLRYPSYREGLKAVAAAAD